MSSDTNTWYRTKNDVCFLKFELLFFVFRQHSNTIHIEIYVLSYEILLILSNLVIYLVVFASVTMPPSLRTSIISKSVLPSDLSKFLDKNPTASTVPSA
jgi:hypothetical protein